VAFLENIPKEVVVIRKEEEDQKVGFYTCAAHKYAVAAVRCSPDELINRCITVFWTPHHSQILIFSTIRLFRSIVSDKHIFE